MTLQLMLWCHTCVFLSITKAKEDSNQHIHHELLELKQTENSPNSLFYSGEYLFQMCRASTCLTIILLSCNDFKISCFLLLCYVFMRIYIQQKPIKLGNDYLYYAGNGRSNMKTMAKNLKQKIFTKSFIFSFILLLVQAMISFVLVSDQSLQFEMIPSNRVSHTS